jgi:hypothetical protein
MLQQLGKADIKSIGATYSGRFCSAIHLQFLIQTDSFQNVLPAKHQYLKQVMYVLGLQN